MTVTVSAWFGVALVLSSCFWLGVWARPRLASLRRRAGGSRGLGRASGNGNRAMVRRVRTYTACSTGGALRAGTDALTTPRDRSRITVRTGSTAASDGRPGALTPRQDAS